MSNESKFSKKDSIVNYYAQLGTHILTDVHTLKKLIAYQKNNQLMSHEQIKQISHILLNPVNKKIYDTQLQNAHPELLKVAEKIINKNSQVKKNAIQKNSLSDKQQNKQNIFFKITKIDKKTWIFILAIIILMIGYPAWHSSTYYKNLEINTVYDNQLDDSIKRDLLDIRLDEQKRTTLDFDESSGVLLVVDGNTDSLKVFANSSIAKKNPAFIDLQKNSEKNFNQTGGIYNAKWINTGILINNEEWHSLINKWNKTSKISFDKLKNKTSFDFFTFQGVSPSKNLVIYSNGIINPSLMIYNIAAEQEFVTEMKDEKNENFIFERVYVSPDDSYILFTKPSSGDPSHADKLMYLEKDLTGYIIKILPLVTINNMDRYDENNMNEQTTLLKTDAAFFYHEILVTLNNEGSLRYWRIPTGELISEIKLKDYKRSWIAKFSSDGRYLWYSTDKKIFAYDLKTGKNIFVGSSSNAKSGDIKAHVIGNKTLWLQAKKRTDSSVLTVE